MRLVTYEFEGKRRLGALLEQETKVLDLNLACAEDLKRKGEGTPVKVADALMPTEMVSFLERGDRGMALAQEIVDKGPDLAKGSEYGQLILERSAVKLCAPVLKPPKIICLGHNYTDFLEETGVPVPPNPRIFSKFHNAVCGPEDDIIRPKINQEFGYEAEMAFIVGKHARNVSEADAYDYVAGYTVFNDVSASDLTTIDKQVLRGKTFDTFAPFGPSLVTKDEVPDPHSLDIKCWVNDKLLQDSNTDQVYYQTPHLVAFLSTIFTLEPGDVVATGTPPGIGKFMKNPTWMWAGDVCTIEIENLGVLKNKVVDEA